MTAVAADYLGWLYDKLPSVYWTTVGRVDSQGGPIRFQAVTVNHVVEAAQDLNGDVQAWARVYPMLVKPVGPHSRGKADVTAGSWIVCVELDRDKSSGADLDDMLQALYHYKLPPTCIVCSGHGYHAYWQLEEFITNLNLIKSINQGLVDDLKQWGADPAAVDVARILRIPGTSNLKDPLHPVPVTLVLLDRSRTYPVSAFPQSKSIPFTSGSADLDEVPIPEDFETRVRSVTGLWERMTTGVGAELNSDGTVDRSANDFYVVKALLELGFSREVCLAAMLRIDWFVGKKTRQRGIDYARRTIGNAYKTYMDSVDRFFIGKKGSKFVPERLVKELRLKDYYLAVNGDFGNLYRYVNGVYRPDSGRIVSVAKELLGERYDPRFVDAAVRGVAADTMWDPAGDPESTALQVNVANCWLSVSANDIQPSSHSPSYKSITQIAAEYDPHAITAPVVEFLRQILPLKDIPTFLEYLGFCLTPGYLYKQALLLVGSGNNGKSRLLDLVRVFLGGDRQVSGESLQALSEDRFSISSLFGKVANICPDLSDVPLDSLGRFKSLTGGDSIVVEQKYQKRFSAKNGAKLIFSANHYPQTHQADAAFFDRWIVIKCPNRFTLFSDEVDLVNGVFPADPHVLERLTTPANLSGLLLLALGGLQRLLTQRHFTRTGGTLQAMGEFQLRTDPIMSFWSTATRIAHENRLPRTDWFDLYEQWCVKHEIDPEPQKVFFTTTRELMSGLGLVETRNTSAPGVAGHAVVYSGREYFVP